MDLLKRQLFPIICAVVSLGSIALGVVGIRSMSGVTDELGKASRRATELQRGAGKPINEEFIEVEQRRIDTITAQYQQVLNWAKERNQAQPLTPGAFPNPDRDQKLAFRAAYSERLNDLLKMLDAGDTATMQDEADAAEQIREEQKLEERFGLDPREAEATGEAVQQKPEEPLQFPSGLFTDYGAKNDPAVRANISKAHRIRCYATMGSIEVFAKIDEGITPDVLDMWDAQVSLWIQESVIGALARVNDARAQEIEEQGQMPWVGIMPIKELISIRTSQYVVEGSAPNARPAPLDWNPTYPRGSGDDAFTHSVSNELFEAVQCTLKMVVDARQIPTIVNEICKDNFYTLLGISYEDLSKEPSTWAMNGRIYGSDPTVKVVLDFETLFFG
ncbi:MAG TPA: hypothetical protein VM243_02065, partial [Phycisphaerae bacterium]|nr:hypothetical protein [Phycisphaerae bacterium]